MKSPRFQFRLRSLMIVVTLNCIGCGWLLSQATIVWERKAMLKIAPVSWVDDDDTAGLTWLRHVMGDRGIGTIVLDKPTTDEQLNHYRAVFPEASIYRTANPAAQVLTRKQVRPRFMLHDWSG